MRMALIAHSLRSGGGASVGKNLLSAMLRVAPDYDYFVTLPEQCGYEESLGNVHSLQLSSFLHTSYLARLWYDSRILPQRLREFRPDLVFGMGNSTIAGLVVPQAMLCHDSHLWYSKIHFGTRRPGVLATTVRELKRARFRQSLGRARLVFCQTKTASRRLRATYGYSGPIELCPNAVSKCVTTYEGKYQVPLYVEDYRDRVKLFCLTRYYPHKNLESLVRLFDAYRSQLANHVLFTTVAPDQHPDASRFLAMIQERGLEDHIVNVGPLEQSQLEAYYIHCDALIMPTLLESFSATYIEAMHFGCPILTSDLDFAHEICGDAAVYFDPWDLSSMMRAITRLAYERELADRGHNRLEYLSLSWEEIAARVIEDLLTIAGNN